MSSGGRVVFRKSRAGWGWCVVRFGCLIELCSAHSTYNMSWVAVSFASTQALSDEPGQADDLPLPCCRPPQLERRVRSVFCLILRQCYCLSGLLDPHREERPMQHLPRVEGFEAGGLDHDDEPVFNRKPSAFSAGFSALQSRPRPRSLEGSLATCLGSSMSPGFVGDIRRDI